MLVLSGSGVNANGGVLAMSLAAVSMHTMDAVEIVAVDAMFMHDHIVLVGVGVVGGAASMAALW